MYVDNPKPNDATSPQHLIVPISNNAHVCCSPSAKEVGIIPAPKSKKGKFTPISSGSSPKSRVFPIPSCPSDPSPQHFTPPVLLIAQECDSPISS